MFNTKVPLYTVCIFLSLILNIFSVYYFKKTRSKQKFSFIKLIIFENIGIIFGCKLFTYLLNNNSKSIIHSGMSSYGGLIGAIIMIVIFKIIYKLDLKNLILVILPSIPLMYSVGKIGCYLVGCCGGFIYSGIGAVSYKYSKYMDPNLTYFPVQLLETIVFFLIFLYIIIINKKGKYNYDSINKIFILCISAKFLLDYFRKEHNGLELSINQYVSIVIILFIIIYNWYKKKISKK